MYGRNAEGVKVALTAAHPELKVFLNPQKPRRNSFEITLVEEEGEGEQASPYASGARWQIELQLLMIYNFSPLGIVARDHHCANESLCTQMSSPL